MSVRLANGMHVDVDRGPDWYFVHVNDPGREAIGFAEAIYDLVTREWCHRVIIELDDVPILKSEMLGQLVLLHKRLHTQGGLVRLSGTSKENQSVLKQARLDGRFPQYASREDAVMGRRPLQPYA